MVGEDKVAGSTFTAVACYSSTDLVHWTRQTNALSRQSSGDLAAGRIVERPEGDLQRRHRQVRDVDARRQHLVQRPTRRRRGQQHAVRAVHLPRRDPAARPSEPGSRTVQGRRRHGIHDPRGPGRRDAHRTPHRRLHQRPEHRRHLPIPGVSGDGKGRRSLLPAHLAPDRLVHQRQRLRHGNVARPGRGAASANFAPSGTRTYDSQTSFLLPITGSAGTNYVYVGDRWNSGDLYSSLPIWLPITLTSNGTAALELVPVVGASTRRPVRSPCRPTPG